MSIDGEEQDDTWWDSTISKRLPLYGFLAPQESDELYSNTDHFLVVDSERGLFFLGF